MAKYDRDPTPHIMAWDHSHFTHLHQGLHYRSVSGPSLALRQKIDQLITDIQLWSNVPENRELFFTFSEKNGTWDCDNCGQHIANWHGHMRSSHPNLLWNVLGFRLNLEEWMLLHDMMEGHNGQYRLLAVLNREVRQGIMEVINNNIRFYKGVVQMVRSMNFKELRAIVVGADNRCLGCGQQVSHLREHVIENHLDDIGFEMAKPKPRPRPPSVKQKYYTRRATSSSFSDIWGNS